MTKFVEGGKSQHIENTSDIPLIWKYIRNNSDITEIAKMALRSPPLRKAYHYLKCSFIGEVHEDT